MSKRAKTASHCNYYIHDVSPMHGSLVIRPPGHDGDMPVAKTGVARSGPEGKPTVRLTGSLSSSQSAVDSIIGMDSNIRAPSAVEHLPASEPLWLPGFCRARPRRDVAGRHAVSSRKQTTAAIAALLR